MSSKIGKYDRQVPAVKSAARRIDDDRRADDAAVVQQTDCRLPHLNIHAGVDARPLDAVASPGVHAVLERSGCDVANCSLDAARATAWSTTAPANHHLCGRAHHHRHHRKKHPKVTHR